MASARAVPAFLLGLLGTGLTAAAQVSSYVELAPAGSQQVEQPAGTVFNLRSELTSLLAPGPLGLALGEVAVAQDSRDRVQSVIGQAGDQLHLRLSRGAADDRGGLDLLVVPYRFGMAVEYAGVIETWTQEFSIHNHPSLPGQGAFFWVGNETDTGGLFATAHDAGHAAGSFAAIAADKFQHTPGGGSLHFDLRDPVVDAFRFRWGPFRAETTRAQIDQSFAQSRLQLFSGPVTAVLLADAGGAVQVGSRSLHRLDLMAGAATPHVSVLPSGSLAVGNLTGSALLSVGAMEEFQVSGKGEVVAAGPITGQTVIAGLNQVPFSPDPLFDAGLGNTQRILLLGSVPRSELVRLAPGQTIHFLVCQDAVGNHGFAWPANVRGGMKVDGTPGTCSAQSFISDGTDAFALGPGMPGL